MGHDALPIYHGPRCHSEFMGLFYDADRILSRHESYGLFMFVHSHDDDDAYSLSAYLE